MKIKIYSIDTIRKNDITPNSKRKSLRLGKRLGNLLRLRLLRGAFWCLISSTLVDIASLGKEDHGIALL